MAAATDFRSTIPATQKRIDEYFGDCDDKGQKYSVSALCLALDIPFARFKVLSKLADEYLACHPAHRQDFKKEHKEFQQYEHLAIFKKALQRVQAQLEARTDSNAIFQLKQPEIAGYTDKPAAEQQAINVNVKLSGMGKDVNFAG